MKSAKRVVGLAVAGLDPSGGAGLIVDLRTYAAFGVHPAALVSVSTIQSPDDMLAYCPVEPEHFRRQLEMLLERMPPHVIKIGALGSRDIVLTLASVLKEKGSGIPLVLDPVLATSSGRELLNRDAFEPLVSELFPLVHVLTPNTREAGRFSGIVIGAEDDLPEAAERIVAMGPRKVIITGGHLKGRPVDHLFDGRSHLPISGKRIPKDVRGTGCAFATALAAGIALGETFSEAARAAKDFVAEFMGTAYAVSDSGTLFGGFPRFRNFRPLKEDE